MPAMNLAMASRQSAILVLIGGRHVGAFVLVAGSLLPRLLETLPQDSVIRPLPRAAEPDVRLRPAAAPNAPDAPGGDASAGLHGLLQPPALRMRDRWSLLEGKGFPRLDSALDCVIRRLKFDPGRRDGIAVTAEVLVPVAFRLN